MPRLAPIRCLAALSIALCPALQAQAPASQLPANSPTSQPQNQLSTQSTAPQPPPPPATHRAEVTSIDGKLSITADNSSLNQILRDISRLTGIKITGGVTEEHVFGKYGPAPPAKVLAALLDGTGSNMLLLQNGAAPAELILTPRTGGATPPNPNASTFNGADSDDDASQSTERLINRGPRQPGQLDPNRPDPPPTLLPPPNLPPDTAPPSTQEQSPNGVKTPQQIYDQLMRLHQQSTQQTAPQ
jgi:hypothetical protein